MVYVFPMCTAAVAGPSAGEDEEALPTYKEAFPPLPEKAAQPEGTQETSSAWASKIRPLKSSIITQVQLLLKKKKKSFITALLFQSLPQDLNYMIWK